MNRDLQHSLESQSALGTALNGTEREGEHCTVHTGNREHREQEKTQDRREREKEKERVEKRKRERDKRARLRQ